MMFQLGIKIMNYRLLLLHGYKPSWKKYNMSNRLFKNRFSSISATSKYNVTCCSKLLKLESFVKLSTTSTFLNNNNMDDTDEEDREYKELVKRTLKLSDTGHQVLIVQPYIKWGRLKKTNTTPQLQLDEAIALVKSLPMWSVVDTRIISLMNLDKTKIFGKGNLEMLSELVTMNKNITAVFLSINMLKPFQHKVVEEIFGVPVFDRYTIVVQIFKLHATTKEAKIQVAMGEIPYLWTRLRYDHEGMSDKMGGGATVGGPGETYLEIKKRLLQDKVRKLKSDLKKLKTQRELLRSKRKNLKIPTIAVVGYTNAGKTSLIRALTREDKLKPRNVLFATLDVTVHAGLLPSGLKVLYVDTVGFLSDIPTSLIQSFVATLEDAVQSDLIIHVEDVSHPDLKAQREHVLETLKSINLPENLLENMITVENKADLISHPLPDTETCMHVSTIRGDGLDILKRKVEEKIIGVTGQIFIKIRVPNGGEEYNWLQREATVVKITPDEHDYQFVFINTLITDTKLSIFKHKFISSRIGKDKV